MSQSIESNLLHNSLDYLLLAGEQAQMNSPRMLKHALATLADGVELLLKARLEVYDWCLLFKNIDVATRDKLSDGKFISVTFDQAVTRLKQICGVEIADSHMTTLRALKGERNKIRHYAITIPAEEAASLLEKTYSFALDFVKENLEEHLDSESESVLNQLRELLGTFEQFVKSRLDDIKDDVAKEAFSSFGCPRCLQDTMYSDGDGQSSCLFCGFSASGEDAAIEHVERHFISRHKDWAFEEDRIKDCPDCGQCAAVYHPDQNAFQCLACGSIKYNSICGDCGELYYDDYDGDYEESGSTRCGECWRAIIDRQD